MAEPVKWAGALPQHVRQLCFEASWACMVAAGVAAAFPPSALSCCRSVSNLVCAQNPEAADKLAKIQRDLDETKVGWRAGTVGTVACMGACWGWGTCAGAVAPAFARGFALEQPRKVWLDSGCEACAPRALPGPAHG